MFRMPSNRAAVLGAFLLAASATPAHSALDVDDEVRIEVGRAFPLISLPLLKDSSPASIADFHGEKVILHIFASW